MKFRNIQKLRILCELFILFIIHNIIILFYSCTVQGFHFFVIAKNYTALLTESFRMSMTH